MRDQEHEYPRHQPGRDGQHNHHDPFAEPEEGELEEPEHRRRDTLHQREFAETPQLPRAHGRKAVIVGIIFGVLTALQGIILVMLNSSVYEQAKNYVDHPEKMPWSLVSTIFDISFFTFAISVVLYFIAGLIIGRLSVQRRWGFIGGLVAGFLNAIIGALVKQVPGYPNVSSTGASGNLLGIGGGLAVLLISGILLGVLAGLISLLAAWLVTRRHPYYVGYSG